MFLKITFPMSHPKWSYSFKRTGMQWSYLLLEGAEDTQALLLHPDRELPPRLDGRDTELQASTRNKKASTRMG